MNKELFVPYEQALALKELGFNEPCFAIYEDKKWQLVEFKNSISYELCLKTDTFPAPTFSQAFRWFRKEHGLYDTISKNGYMIEGELNKEFLRITKLSLKSHEEAELACLIKLIEIVKTKIR
tara:strand:- start:297 stop:662 length:366 start_codon:yes stop_codon:yes gene_type:complete